MNDMIDAGAANAPSMADSSSSISEASSTPSNDAGSGSARDSLERAFAQVDSPDKSGAGDEPAKSDGRNRAPDGKFAPNNLADAQDGKQPQQTPTEASKPSTPLDEPPARFSADAKAAWANLPEAVRGETKRAFTELEQGIARYQETLAPLRPFMDMAQQHGTTVDKALANYVGIEQLLKQDLPTGLAKICENMGVSFRDVAAHVLGQPPEQQASQADATIRELRQHIAALQQQVGGVTSTIQQQQEAALQQQVQAFAADKPRFEELKPIMGQLLQNGMAPDLAQAYEMANRLNPGSVAPQAPAPTPAAPAAQPDLSAQTRKGSLSVTGAPSSGSNPANRKPPSSSREALTRAFASAGLS